MFIVNARNSLQSLAVSSDSESEVEPFITQTKAALVAVLQLSFRKTILNLHLRVQTTGKRLTIPLFAPRIFRPTCLFTDKEDSGRGITTGTDKEIQSRNEARIPKNTKRSTTCLHGVLEFGMHWVKERNALPWQRHFRSNSKPWNFKEIDEPPTKKIRECGAKETQLSLILVIVTSCLIYFQ